MFHFQIISSSTSIVNSQSFLKFYNVEFQFKSPIKNYKTYFNVLMILIGIYFLLNW